MSIKIDLRNQVRQTNLPKWKALLPLFEAVMNSFQAISDVKPENIGAVTIEIEREKLLLEEDNPAVIGFRIVDDGVGLDDYNFDSFNTAFSPHRMEIGGKGLGRFTWLKAFLRAEITSVFADSDGTLLRRQFTFDEDYDLDDRGQPVSIETGAPGTTIELVGYRDPYKAECPRKGEVIVEKLIEHFLLVLLEPTCPKLVVRDHDRIYDINEIFQKDYRANASAHQFQINEVPFTLHGFRLPTSRTTKHKLVYTADQRAVTSDNLEEYLPNLTGRLVDEENDTFFYLGIVQSNYLSEHVTPGRVDFDFASVEDADAEAIPDLLPQAAIRRADIRNAALPLIQEDLSSIIESLNAAKLKRITDYVHTDAPQYRILLKYSPEFIDKLPPQPSRTEIENALHRELYQREVRMKQESTRIIRDAARVDNYDEYAQRFADFMERYNELGASALAQYVAHRKIILELLEKAIQSEGDRRYPLEKVVHQLVFPMRATSEDIEYSHQNLWMIDERLTFHTLISSDNPLNTNRMLDSDSLKRGDIVIFDEKIVFGDVPIDEHPINSITTIEFKRPGRDDYDERDNPVRQAFRLINDIRAGVFKINGRRVSVANDKIPATAYCICDITPTLITILGDLDAQPTPDNQSYYGFNKTHGVYFEVFDYNKMLRDAKKRNRIFFDKLNLVNEHGDTSRPRG